MLQDVTLPLNEIPVNEAAIQSEHEGALTLPGHKPQANHCPSKEPSATPGWLPTNVYTPPQTWFMSDLLQEYHIQQKI